MANQHSGDGSGRSGSSAENSESTVVLNIKTLDSQIYSFHVDKNMLVSSFKEKIANEIGIPVGHQRLIFRGKVLKDDVLLSEYYVENGHTLHLVERQPVQSHSSSNPETGATNGNNSNQENDPNGGDPRHRAGQISHSVVLGTFNVGDQHEGSGMPDINRVIGSVLNSFGIGSQTTTGVGGPQPAAQGFQGNASEGNEAQGGAAVPPQTSLPGFTFPVPSFQMPSPFSLHTLSEFVSRMQLAFPRSGHQPNAPSSNEGPLPTVELPSNTQGLPTIDALIIVLGRVQRLLTDQVVAELSHFTGRLENTTETDPTVRGQIQNESMHLGMTMQCLGSLFLELGRTLSTVRMGQSHADSFVHSGPAIFISELGPNPIMVQPFPPQPNPFFGGAPSSFNPGAFGPAGVPRHINVHIHSGAGVRPSGGRVQGGVQVNGPGLNSSNAPPIVIPLRNIVSTAIPSSTGAAVSNAEPPNDSNSQAPSGMPESSVVPDQSLPPREKEAMKQEENNIDAESIGCSNGDGGPDPTYTAEETEKQRQCVDDYKSEGPTGVPLGLGLNGLQTKKRSKPAKSHSKSNVETFSSNPPPNRSQQTIKTGQQILQSLVSSVSTGNTTSGANRNNDPSEQHIPPLLDQIMGSLPSGDGSNMLSQLSQNPIIRDTATHVFQQIGSQGGFENMVSASGAGTSGGIDLSSLLQQLMPIVSQALNNVSTGSEHTNVEPVENQQQDDDPKLSATDALDDQIDFQQVIRRIADSESPTDIFHSMVEMAVSSNNGVSRDDLVNELCSDESIANEYLEMLQSDMREDLQTKNNS